MRRNHFAQWLHSPLNKLFIQQPLDVSMTGRASTASTARSCDSSYRLEIVLQNGIADLAL